MHGATLDAIVSEHSVCLIVFHFGFGQEKRVDAEHPVYLVSLRAARALLDDGEDAVVKEPHPQINRLVVCLHVLIQFLFISA